jgi:6-phosphogluconolactonase
VRLAPTGPAAGERAGGDVRSPSFLAVHPTLPVVYALEEVAAGSIVTLRRDADGLLTRIDARPALGSYPCHVAVSQAGDWLATANYGDGSASVMPLGVDGRPTADAQLLVHTGSGPRSDRQSGPHCHQVIFDGVVLLLTDLGTDRVHRYVRDGAGWVPAAHGPATLRAGSGPRHLVVDGPYRHVVGELDATVTSYRVGDNGSWHEVGHALTTAAAGECAPSHIVLHDGVLYVANRGPDTIATFSVDDGQPVLLGEVATGGSWPRHFELVGDKLVVANERSDELTMLTVTPGAGVPGPVSGRVATGSPTCVVRMPG